MDRTGTKSRAQSLRPEGVSQQDWDWYLWQIAGEDHETRAAKAKSSGLPVIPDDILA